MCSGFGGQVAGTVFVPKGRVGLLSGSGYTEQPRVLTLGQVVSKGALKVHPMLGMVAR
jgi:hypothetical protein